MRSLLLRIFVSFWSIIVVTIIAAAMLGYFYAERVRETLQSFEVSDAMLGASASLRESGPAWSRGTSRRPCPRSSSVADSTSSPARTVPRGR